MSRLELPSRSRSQNIGFWLTAILVFGYALVRGRFLLGILAVIGLGLLYYSRRFLFAVERIADALQRIAHQREQD